MTDSPTTTGDDGEASSLEGDQPETPKRSRSRSFALFLRDVALILVAAIVISFLIKTFLVRSFYIPSPSMENTLMVNDRIIVNELVPDVMPIERGDVVVFTDPGGWLTPEPDTRSDVQKVVENVLGVVGLAAPDSNDHLIKRVIGLPGDEVSCCNTSGYLRVNGVPIQEPYVNVDPGQDAADSHFDVTVPTGYLWVEGDNRYHSADSAYHYENGDSNVFVPIKNVVGRAVLISWPVSRWAWLDDYPAVFRNVEDSDTQGSK
ncbi:signal peptidase I [Galbitalea sp. SE-J8]|uniref:signal peptidase I n=1 Tax=Galbitalea sp. SE-J8 TaxID=3054952 RepID=UPI00259D0B56|nr:signal peptidase I [Galbitalea sp. SE-J8]MDM4762903.1 signal peptidase I [Galbitalea sp. SE-J8]